MANSALLASRLCRRGASLSSLQRVPADFRRLASASAAVAEDVFETAPFPRTGPGISYALNWALATKGTPPKEHVHRNLTEAELQKHGATVSGGNISGCSIYVHGSSSTGGINITKTQFNKLLKQVQSHLSSKPNLFVHDGAVGSYPLEDARARCICDEPSAALAVRTVLCRTPVRDISADCFPFTIYVAAELGPCILEQLGFPAKAEHGFAVADHDQSVLILGGEIISDSAFLKTALAAVAAKVLLSRGALPLAARILVQGESTVLLMAPESLIQASPSILDMCVTKDANSTWSSPGGVGTFFSSTHGHAPNLFKAPASIVLATIDNSVAIPAITQLMPGQAAYHFLAGYDGENFVPMYQNGPSFLDPLSLSKQLLEKLSTSGVPAYLINASAGEDLIKLIETTITGKLPKSKGKKPSEGAMQALQKKFSDFMTTKFPELPEGMTF